MKAILLSSLLAVTTSTAHAFDLTNGSFETGDFTGWTVIDSPTPFIPMQVSSGFGNPGYGFFTHQVTDGTFGMVMGFETLGSAPVVMTLSQTVTIDATRPELQFTWRAAWDMFNFPNSSMPRRCFVRLRPVGGGGTVFQYRFLRAAAQTINLDTGTMSETVDLSAFAGQTLDLSFEIDIPQDATGPGFMQIDGIRLTGPGVGTNYCMTNPNSTGVAAEIGASGTPVVSNNDLVLECSSMPTNAFAFFLTSTDQGFAANPGGSEGNLCLGGAIGRYVGPGQILNTGSAGAVSFPIDLTQHPTPTGLVSVQIGETWNFQCWFRDQVGGTSTSNFSDGYEVTFQ